MSGAATIRVSETLIAIYFAYLSAAAIVRPMPLARRARVWLSAGLAGAVLAALVWNVLPRPFRDWVPALLILLGYYTSGAFYVAPSRRLEEWLVRSDERWIGARLDRVSPALVAALDVLYDCTFLLIPAGFAALWWRGRPELADHYWTLVVAAEFAAFGTLPFLQARPPWAIEERRPLDHGGVRRFSLALVNRTSICATTLPSGHAAGSLAVAFGVIGTLPMLGVLLLAIAIGICVGCVVGRYHYTVDVIAGAVLAVAIWATVAIAGI